MKALDLRPADIGADITLKIPRFTEQLARAATDPIWERGPFRELTGTITDLSTRSKHIEEEAFGDVDVSRAYNVETVLIRIDDRETIELHPMHEVDLFHGRFIVDEEDLRARNFQNVIVKSFDGLNWFVITGATYCPLHIILEGEDREENTYGVECLGKHLYPLEVIQ